MDLAEFKAKLARSREVEVEIDGAKFLMRLPTEHAWRVAAEEHRGPGGRVKTHQVHRTLVEAALVGWEGVTENHVLLNGSAELVPFDGDTRAILLDERLDIADQLTMKMMGKVKERAAKLETARKNSSRASSGTSTARTAARSSD